MISDQLTVRLETKKILNLIHYFAEFLKHFKPTLVFFGPTWK